MLVMAHSPLAAFDISAQRHPCLGRGNSPGSRPVAFRHRASARNCNMLQDHAAQVLLRAKPGPDSKKEPDSLQSSWDIIEDSAQQLKRKGDLKGAEEMQRRVLDARIYILGPDHPDVLISKTNLALTLQACGNLKGAEDLMRDVMEENSRILGPRHPETLANKDYLAQLLGLQVLAAESGENTHAKDFDNNTMSAFEDRTLLGNLEVSRLGVGTIAWGLRGFGGLVSMLERNLLLSSNAANQAEPVALASVLKGLNFFDTAERYGNSFSTALGLGYGETEELIARTLKGDGIKAVVATKFTPTPSRTTPESVVEACEASRKRLQVDVIDLYQIQIPDIVQPWARVPGAPAEWYAPKDEIYWEGLVRCYKKGIIANVGVSNYGPTLLRRAYEYFKSRGVPLASNQINYSLLYRKKAQATVDTCRELGITVLAYFPLAMGVLTGKWQSSSVELGEPWKAYDTMLASETGVGPVGEPLNPELTGKSTLEQSEIAKLAATASPLLYELEEISKARGKTVAQVALNWIICKGAIPIPGARTAAQVIENAGALGWRLTSSEMDRLESAAEMVEAEFTGAGFKRSNSKFVGYGFEEWSLD